MGESVLADAHQGAGTSDRRAWVAQIMGMPISVHMRGAGVRGSGVLAAEADGAVQTLFDELRAHEARFSTHRAGSEISRLQRGEVSLAECSADVREVERLCRTAFERTDGYFDAWNCVPGRPGLFDPTGLVKTWAVGRAARRLGGLPGRGLTWAVNAGGDVLVRPALAGGEAGEAGGAVVGEAWLVGIEDPADRTRVFAQVPVVDGAVATSGIAARGAHILDPHTGSAATGVASATVVGPSLLWADVFATALVARGPDAAQWAASLRGTSGLLVLADGSTHRWSNPA